jgi:hypothetical protein
MNFAGTGFVRKTAVFLTIQFDEGSRGFVRKTALFLTRETDPNGRDSV